MVRVPNQLRIEASRSSTLVQPFPSAPCVASLLKVQLRYASTSSILPFTHPDAFETFYEYATPLNCGQNKSLAPRTFTNSKAKTTSATPKACDKLIPSKYLHDFRYIHDTNNLKTFTTFSKQIQRWQFMNNTDITGTRKSLDLRMGGVGKSQLRRMVDRRTATAALSRCGQRYLHGEDYIQEVRSLARRQKKALHSSPPQKMDKKEKNNRTQREKG